MLVFVPDRKRLEREKERDRDIDRVQSEIIIVWRCLACWVPWLTIRYLVRGLVCSVSAWQPPRPRKGCRSVSVEVGGHLGGSISSLFRSG